MAALCGPGCGYCGMCTAAWERDEAPELDELEPPAVCDACGASLAQKSINYGFGAFCSEACAAPAERAFAERMARRGFLQVERISK
jgi:hypothetical protein